LNEEIGRCAASLFTDELEAQLGAPANAAPASTEDAR
jgi:hypothetical protein